MKNKRTSWQEGRVDQSKQHIELRWAQDESLICLLQPKEVQVQEKGQEFVVEFVSGIEANRIQAATKELDFYLVELNEPDTWLYAKDHCQTAANVYSEVMWVARE